MASAMKKVNMIAQIVRLKQVALRWRARSHNRPKRPTPSGSVAVYVGPERRRFVIPTRYLNLPVFVALLHEAEEEFGFQTTGGLTLPCETGFFTDIVVLLEDDEERYRGLGLEDFVKLIGEMRMVGTRCKGTGAGATTSYSGPIIQKARV